MKPALLIIIMDFLLSSLLLFVGNGGSVHPQRSYGIFDGTQSTAINKSEFDFSEAEESFKNKVKDFQIQDIQQTQMDTSGENEKLVLLNNELALINKNLLASILQLEQKVKEEEREKKRAQAVGTDALAQIGDLKGAVSEMHIQLLLGQEEIAKGQEKITEGQEAIKHLVIIKTDQIIDTQKQANHRLSDLSDLVKTFNSLPYHHETKELMDNLTKHQEIFIIQQTELLDRLEKIEKTNENLDKVSVLTDQLDILREDFAKTTQKADSALADRIIKSSEQDVSQTFARATNARIELKHTFENTRKWDNWVIDRDTFSTYPVIVALKNGEQRAIANAKNVGLRWNYFQKDMKEVSHSIAKRGDNPWSGRYDSIGTLFSPHCDVVIIKNQNKIDRPLQLYTTIRDAFDNSDTDNLYIYKHDKISSFVKLSSSDIAIEHVNVTNEIRFVPQNMKQYMPDSLSSLQTGDYLITKSGYLLCIMMANRSCKVILEDDINNYNRLSHNDKNTFAQDVMEWKKMCK